MMEIKPTACCETGGLMEELVQTLCRPSGPSYSRVDGTFQWVKINHHLLDNSKVFDGSTYTTHSNLTTGSRYSTFE